jgi:hypothetical protein
MRLDSRAMVRDGAGYPMMKISSFTTAGRAAFFTPPGVDYRAHFSHQEQTISLIAFTTVI